MMNNEYNYLKTKIKIHRFLTEMAEQWKTLTGHYPSHDEFSLGVNHLLGYSVLSESVSTQEISETDIRNISHEIAVVQLDEFVGGLLKKAAPYLLSAMMTAAPGIEKAAAEVGEQGIKQVLKTAGKEAAKEVVEVGTKGAAKEVVQTGAKEAGKEVVEVGTKGAAKEVVQTGTKEAGKEVAQAGAKEAAAKKAAEELATKQAAEAAAKRTAEEAAKRAAAEAAKKAEAEAAKRASEAAAKKAAEEAAAKKAAAEAAKKAAEQAGKPKTPDVAPKAPPVIPVAPPVTPSAPTIPDRIPVPPVIPTPPPPSPTTPPPPPGGGKGEPGRPGKDGQRGKRGRDGIDGRTIIQRPQQQQSPDIMGDLSRDDQEFAPTEVLRSVSKIPQFDAFSRRWFTQPTAMNEGKLSPKESLQRRLSKQRYKVSYIQDGKKVEVFASSLRGVRRVVYGKKQYRVHNSTGSDVTGYFKKLLGE
jgi:hypothetical protein